MNVKEIEKKYEEANEKLINAQQQKKEAERLAALYDAQAEDAALAGDADAYMALKGKAEKQKALAYIQEKQIKKLGTAPIVTKEETVEAWVDYSRSYSAKMKSKLAKYEAAKKKLLEDYGELVSMQNDACEVREKLASYIGINVLGMNMDGGLGSLYPMEYIPCIGKGVTKVDPGMVSIPGSPLRDPDAVFYLSAMRLDGAKLHESKEAQSVNSVVGWRISSKGGR